jgi:hypothetical protein
VEPERDRHHRSLLPGARVAVALDIENLGVVEDRRVEPGRILGLAVEPQERLDAFHVSSQSVVSIRQTGGGPETHRDASGFQP